MGARRGRESFADNRAGAVDVEEVCTVSARRDVWIHVPKVEDGDAAYCNYWFRT